MSTTQTISQHILVVVKTIVLIQVAYSAFKYAVTFENPSVFWLGNDILVSILLLLVVLIFIVIAHKKRIEQNMSFTRQLFSRFKY